MVRSKLCKSLFVFLVIFSFHVQSTAQNKTWNQFRGKMRDGKATTQNLIQNWNEQQPERIWRIDVGSGFPEIVADENNFYLLSSDSLEGAYEFVAAYNLKTAKQIWKTKIDSLYFEVDGWGHGPRATPVVDKDKIFAISGHGKFCALSKKDGNIIWKKDFVNDFSSTIPRWGYTSSPILVNGKLIVEVGGKDEKGIACFNKNNGEIIWSKMDAIASYNSPVMANIDGTLNIVAVTDTFLFALDENGKELWKTGMPLRYPTAVPVYIEPNKIFCSQVGRTGSYIVEVEKGEMKNKTIYKTMQNNWSSSCYYNGYLYGFTKAKLQCVDAESGEIKWYKRGFGKGSLIMVNNNLLVLSDKGLLTMVEANPKEYTELGSVQAVEGKSWTAPSFANGYVFIRNLSEATCLKITK